MFTHPDLVAPLVRDRQAALLQAASGPRRPRRRLVPWRRRSRPDDEPYVLVA